jgi:hypothetical protein
MIETVLAPYRGERVVQQIPVKIPTSRAKGRLRILVSDGDTLDRIGRGNPAFGRKLDLASTIALLNKEHVQQPRLRFAARSRPRSPRRRQSDAHAAHLHHECDGRHARQSGHGRQRRIERR